MDEYDAPDVPPLDLSEAAIAKAKQKIREHYAKRYWESGHKYECLACHRKTLVGRDDLSAEVPRGATLVIYRNLRGAVCTNCGVQYVEVAETMGIEDDLQNAWRATFEGKVTTIGRDSLGLYFPRDVVRNTRMTKNMGVEFEVIDPRTVVLHLG